MDRICKTMLLLMGVATGLGALTGCSKDNDLPAADALFRPVINENDNITHGLDDSNSPYMIVKWDNYATADKYIIKIEANDGTDSREETTDTTFCRFDNLKYDKEYNISLRSANTKSGLQSKDFTLTTTSLDYPTSLSNIGASDVIDTQARIKWASNAGYDKLMIYKDSNDSLCAEISLTEEAASKGEIIVSNLSPTTGYRVEAYSGNSYLGKKRFSTVGSEKYSGVYFDLRKMDDDEGKAYITTDQMAADIAANPDEDITYVLKGGLMYQIKGGTVLPGTSKKIKFVTGLTLEGNAKFRSGGGLGMTAGQDIAEVVFEKIDFISDKAVEGGGNEIATNTDKGFGGRQVFNINGVKATLGKITFKSCSMTGYRALVRAQADNDNINNIVLEDCIINGIGDQGVFTTTNKKCDWQSITMKNCTVTNIVMLCDLRQTTGTLAFTIENCTFCYAPIETIANANTPLLRLGSDNVELKVKNTLFGPAMATEDGGGSKLQTYTAGTHGSIFVSGTPANVDVTSSFKTNFEWTDLNTTGEGDPKVYPLEGLGETGLSEVQLWQNPSGGIFNIIGKLPESGLGDARWQ